MQKSNIVTLGHNDSGIFLATVMLALLVSNTMAQAQSPDEESDKINPRQELAVELPAAPDTTALLHFAITPNTSQSFYIDPKALTVGTDGVVRYTLVAKSSAGASSISYEGIRCQSFEKKLYAFGHADGSWSRARQDEWRPIFKNAANRQHVTLAQDYFCRDGQLAGKAGEIVDRIRNRRPLSISGN